MEDVLSLPLAATSSNDVSLDGVIYEFSKNQLESLEDEFEESSRLGTKVLKGLEINEVSLGLYGRTVLTLESSKGPLLSAHSFTVGDNVQIRISTSASTTELTLVEGVVCTLTDELIGTCLYTSIDWLHQKDEEEISKIEMIPKSMIQIHQKVTKCMKTLQSSWDTLPSHSIVQAAFSTTHPNDITPTDDTSGEWSPLNDTNKVCGLNEVQWKAIKGMWNSKDVISLLHGPPGTGKTTTIAEYIYQYCIHHPHKKILVTAPSNVAVDNVLQKLSSTIQQHIMEATEETRKHKKDKKKKRIQMVRLGHPARMNSNIVSYSLENAILSNEGTAIVQDVKKELQELLSSRKRNKGRDLSALRKEIRVREGKIVLETIASSQVLFATNMGAANKVLNDVNFDLIVMDEAAQATEASSWIPLLLRGTKKVVLAGDHCQLPPTVISQQPQVQKHLSTSLFQRLIHSSHTNNYLLTIQYRMHPTICQWSSQAMYQNQLKSHSTMSNRTLRNYPSTITHTTTVIDDLMDVPLLLVDTSNCELYEQVETPSNNNKDGKKKGSRCNPGEAKLVQQHVEYLMENCGVLPKDIAIISPYNSQVQLLKQYLLHFREIDVKSVDGFQGGERDVVILSLVRSSPKGGQAGIGFLSEQRRLNVAITRAKRHVAIICDVATISQNEFLHDLVEYVEEHGEVRSAMEYSSMGNISTSTTTMNNTDWTQDIFESQSNTSDNQMKKEKANHNTDLKTKKLKKQYDNNNNKKDLNQKKKQNTDDRKRRDFQQKLEFFKLTSHTDETLDLGTSLTSYERMIVHELADSMNLQHESIGENDNRRIIISQPKLSDENTKSPPSHETKTFANNNSFYSLENEDDDKGDKGNQINSAMKVKHDKALDTSATTTSIGDNANESMNSTLKQLALDRQSRQTKQQDIPKPTTKSKKKKKKGQKLGGEKKKPIQKEQKEEHIEDEMAFLDAQIEKVQNSHGRKIVASGSNYKTIVNGILISKPKENGQSTKPKNQRAASALNTKIRQSQEGRKPRKKKK